MLDVSHINLDNVAAEELRQMYIALSDARRGYIDAAKNERTRAERIAAGMLVSEYLKKKNRRGVLYRSKRGKPLYRPEENEKALYFSVSHSYPLVYAAFSDVPVGIDVEVIGKRPQRNIRAVTRSRFFTDGEQALLTLAADGAYQGMSAEELFFHVWTAKEAYSKAADVSMGEILGQLDYERMLHRQTDREMRIHAFSEEGGVVTICRLTNPLKMLNL